MGTISMAVFFLFRKELMNLVKLKFTQADIESFQKKREEFNNQVLTISLQREQAKKDALPYNTPEIYSYDSQEKSLFYACQQGM